MPNIGDTVLQPVMACTAGKCRQMFEFKEEHISCTGINRRASFSLVMVPVSNQSCSMFFKVRK